MSYHLDLLLLFDSTPCPSSSAKQRGQRSTLLRHHATQHAQDSQPPLPLMAHHRQVSASLIPSPSPPHLLLGLLLILFRRLLFRRLLLLLLGLLLLRLCLLCLLSLLLLLLSTGKKVWEAARSADHLPHKSSTCAMTDEGVNPSIRTETHHHIEHTTRQDSSTRSHPHSMPNLPLHPTNAAPPSSPPSRPPRQRPHCTPWPALLARPPAEGTCRIFRVAPCPWLALRRWPAPYPPAASVGPQPESGGGRKGRGVRPVQKGCESREERRGE
jgi:hypothetical protein